MTGDVLILGASAESLHAIDVAHERGYRVMALDGSSAAPGLAAADESAVVDIMDTDAVMAFLGQRRPCALLPVPIGRALVSTEEMNDLLGLPGVSAAAAEFCTDKYKFASTLSARGLRDAKCYLAEDVLADESLLKAMRPPMIVKPRYGSGSRGVARVDDAGRALSTIAPGDVVEECFPGDEFGVDGIVKDGEFRTLMIRRKVNTPPPACQCVGYLTISREDPIYVLVDPYMAKIVQVAGLENGLFHADVMVSCGRAFAIEVSARPSGHSISAELVELATGYDPIDLFLRCCVEGEPLPSAASVEPLFMGFFDFGKGKVAACPDPDYLKEKYRLLRYVQNFEPGAIFGRTVDGTVTERGRFTFKVDGADVREVMESLLGEFEVVRF